jgi:RHS repeat-associated protein
MLAYSSIVKSYTHDPVRNRTTAGNVTNAGNQLTADATHSYQYDDNGNLTRKTLLATGNYTQYTYDAENRLTKVEEFAAGNPTAFATSTYRYDGLGRRIEKVANGQTKRYVYDGEDILLEYDGANVLQARYTHGPGIDEPIAVTKGSNTFFYHQDGLGSVTDLTDSAGATAKSYAYDAYGNILESPGTLEQPYTYTGREFDAESGLYYYRARYYDPTSGRFLQKDPIGLVSGDPNLYRYVFNRPLTLRDPSGFASSDFDCFKSNFEFAFDTTNDFFFGGFTRLARTGVGAITSGAVARSTGFTTIGMAFRPLLAGQGVANLGVAGTIASVGANAVANGAIATIALETGVIAGSALDAAVKTFIFGACPSGPCEE